ncbi:MAG: response regulator [Gallionellaceae bacterium]|jgi:CheY-like chemotaxis protein
MTEAILFVEDSDDDFFATMRVFNKAGLLNPVQRCSNGERALDYLYQQGEFSLPGSVPMPGIILLDLNMPGTEGRDVLRTIKSDPQLHQIPVIVLTTSYAREDITGCYEGGADSYLQKPVDFAGFAGAVGRINACRFEIEVPPKELQ